jgi:hypothetical protein
VPGLELELPPPPPPPQPANAAASINAAPSASGSARRPVRTYLLLWSSKIRAIHIAQKHQPGPRPSGRGGRSDRGIFAEGAVVLTETVTLLPGAAEPGETVQVDSEGAPVQLKLTVPDIPPSAPTLRE